MENFFCGSKEVELVLVEDENDFIDPLETDIFLDSEELQMDENKLQLNDDVYDDCDLLSSEQADDCESTTLPIITAADIVQIDVKNEHDIDSCSSFGDNDSNDIYISTSNLKSEPEASKNDDDKQNEEYSDDPNSMEMNKIGHEPCNASDSNHHGSRKIKKRTRNVAKKMTRAVTRAEKPIKRKTINRNATETKEEKLVEFRVRPDPKRVSLSINDCPLFKRNQNFECFWVFHRKEPMPDRTVKEMQYQKKPNIMRRTTKNF